MIFSFRKKDNLFLKTNPTKSSFKFNKMVVSVFNDMISRSVPAYNQVIADTSWLINHYYQSNTLLYDLGCSTGSLLGYLNKKYSNNSFKYVGVDNSLEMLKYCQKRFLKDNNQIHFLDSNIEDVNYSLSSVIVANFTLQFLESSARKQVVHDIYKALINGGVFILSEKLKEPNKYDHNLFVERHEDFKREEGYSDLEIARKKEALDNILIPYTLEEYFSILENCGFKKIILVSRRFNFATILAIK